MSKLKLKIGLYNILLDLVAISLFLIIIHKITTINQDKIIDDPYLVDLLHNWSNKPIRELYIPKNTENCDRYFLNYKWEGVPVSCDCKSSNNGSVKGNIYKGKCNILNSILGCETIRSIEPQNAQKWKNSNICIREYELDFSESLTVLGNKCPKHYLLCGTDTKNFSLCFPKTHGCPVNYIRFSNSEKKTSDKITHTLKLNEDWYIHYSNKFTNNTIPIDIKYTEGRVCVNPVESNIKSTHLKYKKDTAEIELEKQKEKQKNHFYCTTKIGKTNFDERYNHLDSNSKFKFFTDNRITNELERIPHLNSQDLISQTSNIYFRSFIHWSPYCRQDENLNHESMLKDISKLVLVDSFYPLLEKFMLFLLVVQSIVLMFFWINVFFEKKNKNTFNESSSLKNKKEEMLSQMNIGLEYKLRRIFSLSTIEKMFDKLIHYSSKIQFIFLRFLIFSVAAIISNIIFSIYLNEKNNSIYERFISQKCGDIITNEIFNQTGKHLSDIILNNYQILLYSIFLIGAIILKTIL